MNNIMENTITTKTSRRSIIILIGCLFFSIFLCFSQIIGNSILIFTCLSLFLLFGMWASYKDWIFPVLLYFLPWSPLMKIQNGGISFFTIALLITCIIFLIKNNFSLKIYQIILTALLVILTLTAKVLQGNSIANNYLFFIVMFLLFPCIFQNRSLLPSFWYSTLFFACGIVVAALSAQLAAEYPNILQYIKVDSYLNITRLSGYYGDPNFYCAQITACLAGVQLLLSREQQKYRQLILLFLMVALIYCGLLSASKSFIIVTILLIPVWIIILLEKRNRTTGKIGLLLVILCIIAVALSSQAFSDLLEIVYSRFSSAANISEFTTGRTDLWLSYLDGFSHNISLFLFGEGYTDVTFNGRASHNTIIQGVYQFGIIGFPIVLLWYFFIIKNIFSQLSFDLNWKSVILMCIGIALPWMALDILFFDEVFLLPIFGAIGIKEYGLKSK